MMRCWIFHRLFGLLQFNLNAWYVAKVMEVDVVTIMHPKAPSHNFYWPSTSDQLWVPFDHIVCKIYPELGSRYLNSSAAVASAV